MPRYWDRSFGRCASLTAVVTMAFCVWAGIGSPVAWAQAPFPGTLLEQPAAPIDYERLVASAREASAAGDFDRARLEGRAALAMYSRSAEVWALVARAERRLELWPEAAESYGEVIRLRGPGFPDNARYWQAVSYAKSGDEDRALAALETFVFEDGMNFRPELSEDDNFASLIATERFRAIAGRPEHSATDRATGWRSDLDYLSSELGRNNPHRGSASLARFQAEIAVLQDRVSELNDAQIYVEISRLVADLRQGHSGIWPARGARVFAFTQLPCKFYLFPDGLYIFEAADQRDLVGARVTALNGVPIDDVLGRVAEVTAAEGEMQRLWTVPSMLRLTQVLEGLGLAAPGASIAVTVQMPNETVATRSLAPIAFTEHEQKLTGARGAVAETFARVSEAHWLKALPDDRTLFVQVNQMSRDADQTLEEFGETVGDALSGGAFDTVIVDLRHNNGGDTTQYTALLRALVGYSLNDDHSVIVLIGRGTYSATTNFATDLERLARPVFVGEETGQGGNQDGDASAILLPYSGVTLAAPSVRWQLSSPWDERRGRTPDVPVQLTSQDFFAGRDNVLETALLLSRRHREDVSTAQR